MSETKTIAIIGAGIVGVSTAIWLQRDGHKVILIDRDGPAAGARCRPADAGDEIRSPAP